MQQEEEYTLSLQREPVSQAQVQLFGPTPARWRVVATLGPRASLAELLCRLKGNQQRPNSM